MKEQKCTCGAVMPTHLLFGLTSHHCTCGRRWVPNKGRTEFIEGGAETNPIAEYDFGKMSDQGLFDYSKRRAAERRNNPHRQTLPHPTKAEFDQLVDAAHLAWNDDHETNVAFRYGVAADTDKKGVCRGLRIWVKQLESHSAKSKVLYRLEMSGPDKATILQQMLLSLDVIAGRRHSMPTSAILRLREYIAEMQRQHADYSRTHAVQEH